MKNHGWRTERAVGRRMARPFVFAGLALATALSLGAIASAATSTITVGNLVLKIRSSVSPKEAAEEGAGADHLQSRRERLDEGSGGTRPRQ